MRWQKVLRLAIALFVVAFAALVVVSLRHGRRQGPPPTLDVKDKAAVLLGGKGHFIQFKKGKDDVSIWFGNVATYSDNHSIFGGGVKVVIPDKEGRRVEINSQDAEVTNPPGKQIGKADFKGGVTLTTSDGITLKSDTATYSDDDQIARIPGKLTFTRGRMSGTATGATYDVNRRILWLLQDAVIDEKPDQTGTGAVHVTAQAAGMARLDHYMRFTGGARFDGEGHIIQADEAVAFLTQDDEKVQRMELRGNSRITGKPGQAGPQSMRAHDIDVTYAPDGRTLQTAHLMQDASVALPGEAGKPPKQIAAKGIDVTMAPDGSTVTNLTANESVQVDLPPDGDIPQRRIRAAALIATGTPPGGITNAAFVGDVEFRETRAAKGTLAAIDRTAKSLRLDAKTKPGFGDLESAEFHGNVHFTDAPDTTAEAPMAIYSIAKDTMDLTPNQGDVGTGPHVANGRITVESRNIQMALTSQKMKADTNVRSRMIQQSNSSSNSSPGAKGSSGSSSQVKMPSMLKPDKPVNVKSNRLDYDGDKSVAIYSGNAHLWQDDTDIKSDTIVLEDKTGNLHATTNVTTVMTLEEADDKPTKEKGKSSKAPVQPTTTTAQDLVYVDGEHRATYTGSPHMKGPDGDVTADTIVLFLAEQGGQLERAEADGNVVSKQEQRRAFGKHLTYVAKEDIYTIVGLPAKVYDDVAPNCKYTEAATVSFKKAANSTSASGSGSIPQHSQNIACGTVVGGSF
ncbi:MAG TPA: LptA/OstA family protein [Vicinamibacterales bacterium]